MLGFTPTVSIQPENEESWILQVAANRTDWDYEVRVKRPVSYGDRACNNALLGVFLAAGGTAAYLRKAILARLLQHLKQRALAVGGMGCGAALMGIALCVAVDTLDTSPVIKVRFKAAEFDTLRNAWVNSSLSQAKTNIASASLFQSSQRLWKTGSTEHVAMKVLGPWAVTQFCACSRRRYKETAFQRAVGVVLPFMAKVWQRRQVWVSCHSREAERTAAVSAGTASEDATAKAVSVQTQQQDGGREDGVRAPDGGGEDPGVDHTISIVPATAGEARMESVDTQERGDAPGPAERAPCTEGSIGRNMWQDSDEPPAFTPAKSARDAELRTMRKGSIVDVNGCLNVLGVDHAEGGEAQVRAAIVAPIPAPPIVFANSAENVKVAIDERITKKQLPFKPTTKDKNKIGKVVYDSMKGRHNVAIFHREKVEAWAVEKLHCYQAQRSKKWSEDRMSEAVNKLIRKVDPFYMHKASVKAENMPKGKAPRMLIADGDDGTVMALVVIKCFEDLLFKHMEVKSIKHLGKRDAIDRVISELNAVKGGVVIEGDGSAWDTCCSQGLRDIAENPIMRYITQILAEGHIVPESWLHAHYGTLTNKKLKLFLKDNIRVTINAIRRSGHRGTSCLNWWLNFLLWMCCLYEHPERFLNPVTKQGVDVWGETRRTTSAFEGDDSALKSAPGLSEHEECVREFWTRHGFHMKLVFATTRATFAGHVMEVKDGELTGLHAPDLHKSLGNSGVSCSPSTIDAAKRGDVDAVKRLSGTSALGRALDFAGIFPTVSKKYQELYKAYGANWGDHELQMRVGEDTDVMTVSDRIDALNAVTSPVDEMDAMSRLGYAATVEEIEAFWAYPWMFENFGDLEGFATSLPSKWQPK